MNITIFNGGKESKMRVNFRHAKLGGMLLLGTALTGCATNTLRLDRAATMTDAGREATGATLRLMDEAVKFNRQAIIELAVLDPNCTLPQPSILLGTRGGRTILCPDGGSTDKTIPFARIVKKDMLPTIAVIDGITAYLDSVDEIVNREPLDLVSKLTSAKAGLESVSSDVATIIGVADPKIIDLDDDQRTAVNSAIALISTLIDEANRVNALRGIERNRDQKQFTSTIKSLDTLNANWASKSRAMLKVQAGAQGETYRTSPPADPATRRTMVTEQMNRLVLEEQIVDVEIALRKVNAAFTLAHADYLDLLFNKNAKLSRAEKAKKSALIRNRVRAALASVASLVRAF